MVLFFLAVGTHLKRRQPAWLCCMCLFAHWYDSSTAWLQNSQSVSQKSSPKYRYAVTATNSQDCVGASFMATCLYVRQDKRTNRKRRLTIAPQVYQKLCLVTDSY